MRSHRLFVALTVVGLVLGGAVTPAAAHESVTVDGYQLTFGGSDEPVITGERMWLQVEITVNETEEPVDGQADNLTMAVQRPFGNDTLELDVESVFGQPGLYQGAILFTEPGTYTVYINGSIDGTSIETSFQKKVHNASDLRYPRPASSEGSGYRLDTAIGYGLGAVTASIGMTAAFLVGRRL